MTVELREWQEAIERRAGSTIEVMVVDLAELVERCASAEARTEALEEALAREKRPRRAAWTPGDRVRLNDQCPWLNRRGCEGTVVGPESPQAAKVYPWPHLGRNELVVLLDHDPLALNRGQPSWSCVIDAGALDRLGGRCRPT